MKILMTAGGTEEAIDGVRRISNSSTGRTGAVLARHFLEKGAELMLLHSPGAECRDIESRKEVFSSFADLEGLLRRNLGGERWDVLVHLAAVGDYSISSIEIGGGIFSAPLPSKIPGGEAITLRLKPNPKLVDRVRQWSVNSELSPRSQNSATPPIFTTGTGLSFMPRAGMNWPVNSGNGLENSEGRLPHDHRGSQVKNPPCNRHRRGA